MARILLDWWAPALHRRRVAVHCEDAQEDGDFPKKEGGGKQHVPIFTKSTWVTGGSLSQRGNCLASHGRTRRHALASDARYHVDHLVNAVAIKLAIPGHTVDPVPALGDLPARQVEELSRLR